MHPVIENILEKPAGYKAIVWLLSVAVLCGLFWQLSIGSKLEQQTKLEDSVNRLDSDISTERHIAARIDKARDRLKDLEIRLKEALAQLPDKSEVDDLLEKISNIARESGLELSLFQRKDDNIKEFYAEVPVAVSVTGTYHQVATFFDEVGRLPRIVNISQIAIFPQKKKDEQGTLQIDCLLTAFRYLNDQERAATQAAAMEKDKKKRR